jgi:hypothetical protein
MEVYQIIWIVKLKGEPLWFNDGISVNMKKESWKQNKRRKQE